MSAVRPAFLFFLSFPLSRCCCNFAKSSLNFTKAPLEIICKLRRQISQNISLTPAANILKEKTKLQKTLENCIFLFSFLAFNSLSEWICYFHYPIWEKLEILFVVCQNLFSLTLNIALLRLETHAMPIQNMWNRCFLFFLFFSNDQIDRNQI